VLVRWMDGWMGTGYAGLYYVICSSTILVLTFIYVPVTVLVQVLCREVEVVLKGRKMKGGGREGKGSFESVFPFPSFLL